jgi:putative FmdB family regulatory protein
MPLYQYECSGCEAEHEAFAPMARCAEPVGCPACGAVSYRVYVAPHVESDATVYTSDRTDIGQFRSEAMREFHMERAKKAGVNTAGKKYDPSIARFPGDPKAWVGSDTDVRQVLEHRGWGSKGKVKVAPRFDGHEAPQGGLAEKHVRQLVHERMTVDPGQKLSKVVEDVVNDHAPRGAKRILRSPKRKARK